MLSISLPMGNVCFIFRLLAPPVITHDVPSVQQRQDAQRLSNLTYSRSVGSGTQTPDNPAHSYSHVVQNRPHSAGNTHSLTRGNHGDQSSRPSSRDKPALVIGSCIQSRLKASLPKTRANDNRKPNRSCTGIFVTRLQPKCSTSQVATHIKDISGANTKPEKLQTKYDSYSSFYIRCNNQLRNSLMKPTSWPSGVMVKLFFD